MLKILVLIFSMSAMAQEIPVPHGYYSKGKLLYAWELPLEGEGFMRLFLERNRGWGTESIINMIKHAAREMNQEFPMRDRLQIGDISALNGGKITRHASHQHGLDVDLTYYRTNSMEQLPDIFDGFSEEMVIEGKISPNFDLERNWQLIKALHRNGSVHRIFVDQIIKNELCAFAKKIGEDNSEEEVLRSLRHENDHSDHLHVRLRCPAHASACIPQEDPPAGTGCL